MGLGAGQGAGRRASMLLLSKQVVVRDDDSEVWLLVEVKHSVRVRVRLSLHAFVALRVTDRIKIWVKFGCICYVEGNR